MSWQIKPNETTELVVLNGDISIQNAAGFYQAVLPLAVSGKAVRIDATQAKSLHTSILQILYALWQAVEDFGVTGTSEEFRSAEVRVGLSFPRSNEAGIQGNGAESET